MSLTLPTPIVEPFAINGVKNVIPVPSQIGITPGAASFNDGFPPQTMISLVSGGIPPSGLDFNGIFYLISAYCSWLQGGGWFQYDADFVTLNTGYGVGAILQSAVDPSQFFYNTLADNPNDPDSVTTGWVSYSPIGAPTGTQAQNVAAGAQVVAVTAATGFLDLTPNAGATTITNLTGGNVGQSVTVCNLSAANPLTIQQNANIRMVGDLTLLEKQTLTLRRRTATQWVPVIG